jgi:chemotaxis protein CheD
MMDRRNGGVDLEGVLVGPGELAVVLDGSRLVSVVGAGVAVCLWAEGRQVAAMAHFLEPRTGDAERSFARYGNVAVPEVVRLVRDEDPHGTIEAQIFGGAQEYQGDLRGERNLDMAEMVLAKRRIEVSSRDVGGTKGRKVVFDGKTGQVAVMKVHKLRKEDWQA